MPRVAFTLALTVALVSGGAARASFQCRTQALSASAGPVPDRAEADRAARRAWEAAAHHAFGHPYRWVLAEHLPASPEIASGAGGFTATVRAHPCIVLSPGSAPALPRGLPAACAAHPDLDRARGAGCPFFYPMRR